MGIKGVYAEHKCSTCGETNPNQFHGRQKTRCKKCQGLLNEENRVKRRMEAIEYKGGKCERCGYSKYRGALEFHHKDPLQKDIKSFRPGVARKKFLAEVDKCELLCANCHREAHAVNRG